MVLRLFCSVAHFEEPRILVTRFLAVAHFDYVCDVMVTTLLGLASELIAAEVISKKKMIHCLLMLRMASPRSELIYKGKYGHCASHSRVLVRMVVHMHHYYSTSFDLQTHCYSKSLWPTRLTFCGPAVENQCFRATLYFCRVTQ